VLGGKLPRELRELRRLLEKRPNGLTSGKPLSTFGDMKVKWAEEGD